MRLASQRPRVTVSRIKPQVKDRKAITIKPVARTAVGSLGTSPVWKYSDTTGAPIRMATAANKAATVAKNNSGRSSRIR